MMLTPTGRARIARRWPLVVLAAGSLLTPAGASAATKTVQVGPFEKPAQKAFDRIHADANAFFRRTITIHPGDRVSWRFNGFHTVTFLARGGTAPPLFLPDAAHPVSGLNDAAGQPFWFNGQPSLTFNRRVAFLQGGRVFRADHLLSSGTPSEEGKPKPYVLTFKRTGSFRYVCLIHRGMRGTVRVVKRSTIIPTTTADQREARRERATILAQARRLSTGLGTSQLQSTIQAGNDKQGAAVYKFFPANLQAKVGQTVRLQMPPTTGETHTFSFGPTNGKDLYLDRLAAGFITPQGAAAGAPTLVVDPRAGYPSERPTAGIPGYDGANHGNGFLNTGPLDRNPASATPPNASVTFTKAGTFTFICLIHPFMHAVVTVAP